MSTISSVVTPFRHLLVFPFIWHDGSLTISKIHFAAICLISALAIPLIGYYSYLNKGNPMELAYWAILVYPLGALDLISPLWLAYNREKLGRFLGQIQKVTSLCGNRNKKKNYKFIFYHLIIYPIIYICRVLSPTVNNSEDLVVQIHQCIATLMCHLTILCFTRLMNVLTNAFTNLRLTLEDKSEINYKTIEKTLLLHQVLFDSFQDLNVSFTPQILLSQLAFFCNAWISVTRLLKGTGPATMYMAFNFLLFTFTLMTLLNASERLTYENKKLNNTIRRIVYEDFTGELAKKPKLLMHFKTLTLLTVKVGDFYNANYSSATAMLGVLSSFIIVLLQDSFKKS